MVFCPGRRCKNARTEKKAYGSRSRSFRSKAVIFLFLAFPPVLKAQYAQLEVGSQDKSLFFVAVDSVLKSSSATSFHFIDSISPGSRNLWFIEDSTFRTFPMAVEFSPGIKYVYDLVKVAGKPALLLVTEGPADTARKADPAKGKKQKEIKPPQRNYPGLTLDSLLLLSAISGYEGPSGCPAPVLDPDFAQMKEELQNVLFQKDRYEIAARMLATHCLKTEQVAEVIDMFEFDDVRLNLIVLVKDRIFDLDNIAGLELHLSLTSSREKFRKLTGR